jgi:FeS assembly SUF system protein
MGIFSFLRSKDTAAAAAAPVGTADELTVAAAPQAGGEDLPFAAPEGLNPEGLNIDALTAPAPEAPAGASEVGPVDPTRTAELQPRIVEALKTVYDPEIPVDIYELGLIYDILVDAERRVLIKMTLTSPACPSAQQIPSEVRYKVKAIDGVTDAWVDIVWDPPWGKERMSEAARLQLGFF